MDLYRITITHAPSEEEKGSYLSLSPWAGDTTKYHATCSPVSVPFDRENPPHFAYTRVSNKEQGDRDNSHPQQMEAIARFAAEQGDDPSRLIFCCETGEKRYDPPEKRQGLQKILTNIRRNSRVYLYNRDRFASGILGPYITYLIRQAGGTVLSCQGFNTESVGDRITRAVGYEMAQEEIENTSRRVTAVMRSRKKKGLTYCRRRYGYDKVNIQTGEKVDRIFRHHKDDDFRYVKNEKEQEVIKRILRQKARGDSYNNIARELNRAKVPPPSGTIWHHTSVASVLRSNQPKEHTNGTVSSDR